MEEGPGEPWTFSCRGAVYRSRAARPGRARRALPARSSNAIGRFRYFACVKCPYRVAGKASAPRAYKWAPGQMPVQSCGQSINARRRERYTENGLFEPTSLELHGIRMT